MKIGDKLSDLFICCPSNSIETHWLNEQQSRSVWPKCLNHYWLTGMRSWQRFLHSNADIISNAWTISSGTSKPLFSVLLWCSWLWWQIQAGCLGSRDRETAVGLWFVVGLWSLLTTWRPGPSLWQNEELTMDLHVVVLRLSSHCNSRKYSIYEKTNSLLISYCQSLYSHSRYFQYATLSKYLFHLEQCMCIFSLPAPRFV